MANKEKQTNIVRLLMNPKTKEYKDISADRILVNGVSLGDILDKINRLENDFNVSIRLLNAQVNALKNVAVATQTETKAEITNIKNSITNQGGKL